MKKLSVCFLMIMGLFLATGCQSTPRQIEQAVGLYKLGDYPGAERLLAPEAAKKDESFVLNNCRMGSAALAANDMTAAEGAFLAAYEVINGVNTNSGGRTLGASLVFEGVKVWKGEPFERAMAHYYLGLIYLTKNDYENARAAFTNSLFKLREYADGKNKGAPADKYKPFESNFAMGYFGVGLCYLRMNESSLAEANFKRALELQPTLAPVIAQARDPKTNTWIFVDLGHGPKRAPKGWYNEESAFGPTPAEAGPVPPVLAYANGQALSNSIYPPLVDTLAMAQDQKWQDIDTIRKTKAVIGTGAMAAGTGVAAYGINKGSTETALIGLGIAAAGAALAASSQADLRYWETLPRCVMVIPAALAPGEQNLQISVGGAMSPEMKIPVKPQGDTVLYVRAQ